jgi:hypothetical protein
MEPNSKNPCKSKNANGEPCRGFAGPEGLCFAHTPALDATHAEARLKGGRNRSNIVRAQKLMPSRLVPVFVMMKGVLADVYNDKMDNKKAQTIALVARALVAIFTAGELEERLRALEEKTEKDHPNLGSLR